MENSNNFVSESTFKGGRNFECVQRVIYLISFGLIAGTRMSI